MRPELIADVFGVRRGNRLCYRLSVGGPVDPHRSLPFRHRPLPAAVAVDGNVGAVVVGAVTPTPDAATVRLVRWCLRRETLDLEVTVPDYVQPEHLPAECQVTTYRGALDVLDDR